MVQCSCDKETSIIFRFSETMRVYGRFVLLLMGFFYLVMLLPLILFPPNELYYRMIPFLILLSFPFSLLGFYWGYRHSGQLILTDEAIILQHWGREQLLFYKDIISAQSENWHIPPNIVFKSESKTLKFSRLIEDYPKFYKFINQKIKILNKPLKADNIFFPWKVSIQRRFWILSSLQLIGLIIILTVICVVIPYSNRKTRCHIV